MTGKRILIVLFGAIGDVTQALPVAVRMKRAWPDCHISWAIEPPSKTLLDGHPAVDRVVLFDRAKGFPAYVKCVKELRSDSYDLVLDLQRHFKSGVTSWLSRGKQRIGFHRRNAKEWNWLFNNDQISFETNRLPKIEHYQRFLDHLRLPPLAPLEFQLTPTDEMRSVVKNLIEEQIRTRNLEPRNGFVGLVVGASWESKLWPKEHYRNLITRLYREEGLISVVVGGKSEAEIAHYLLEDSAPAVDLTAKLTLRQLCAAFEICQFVIGSDSGPAHIAGACGKKVITLWGATSPLRSVPYGNAGQVLKSAIGCSPCYRRKCPGLGTLCMKDIPVEAVILRMRSTEAAG